jgi:two-component system nitrate/nitrite sensor histidine kinase NarX
VLISDDGCGFDTTTRRPGHFGLRSMRERAASLGATLTLTSAVGTGTQVRVAIPANVHGYG